MSIKHSTEDFTNSVNDSGAIPPPPTGPVSTGMNKVDLKPNVFLEKVQNWRGRKKWFFLKPHPLLGL